MASFVTLWDFLRLLSCGVFRNEAEFSRSRKPVTGFKLTKDWLVRCNYLQVKSCRRHHQSSSLGLSQVVRFVICRSLFADCRLAISSCEA